MKNTRRNKNKIDEFHVLTGPVVFYNKMRHKTLSIKAKNIINETYTCEWRIRITFSKHVVACNCRWSGGVGRSKELKLMCILIQ